MNEILSLTEARVFFDLSEAADYLPREQINVDRRVSIDRINKLRKKGIPIRTIFAKPYMRGKQVLGYRLERRHEHP